MTSIQLREQISKGYDLLAQCEAQYKATQRRVLHLERAGVDDREPALVRRQLDKLSVAYGKIRRSQATYITALNELERGIN